MADMVGLYSALSGLRAAQAAIDTATHNVANVSTPGYTRQRVDLANRAGQTGVDLVGISRARDQLLDSRVRSGSGTLGSLATRAGLLENAERLTGEPGSGIGAALGEVWVSFSDVALDPAATGPRSNAIHALARLAGRVAELAAGWAQAAADAAEGLAGAVDEVNRLAAEVAGLNGAIVAAGPGAPNDLADRRDAALDRLAELAAVTITPSGDGAVRVSIAGMGLVDGTTAAKLAVDPASHEVLHPAGPPVAAGGTVGGYQGFLTADLPGLRSDLDVFASELAAALNSANGAGWTSDTTAGGDLLAFDPANPAATLTVAVSDPSEIAAAATPGPPYPVFDGSNADAIAGLRSAPAAAGGTTTLDAAWRAVVTRLGATTAAARTAADARQSLQASAELGREAAHGVSLDEELAHLLQFQRAYEAAARVMTAVDEALEVLVRRTGLVGR